MNPKVIYHPLINIVDDPQTRTRASRPKMTRILRYAPQAQDSRQALKKRFKTLHKISVSSQDPEEPLTTIEIRRLTTHLKRMKQLSYLKINVASLEYENTAIRRFYEFLKHAKHLSYIHFYVKKMLSIFDGDQVKAVSRALRYIRVSPKMKVKFSSNVYSFREELKRLIKSFNKHKCFTSTHFSFKIYYQFADVQEVITILSNSKSLSELSLKFQHTDFTHQDPSKLPHDIFRALKKMKSVQNCRVRFKRCTIVDSNLKGLLPAIKEAAQTLNLEIVIDEYGQITKLGWWMFTRALGNFGSSHKINAKYIGPVNNISVKQMIGLHVFSIIIGVIVGVLIVYLSSFC